MTCIDQFESSLQERGRSLNTIKSYRSDLRLFEKWLGETYGELTLEPAVITKLDVAHYRSHLMNVAKRKPAGINRALAAIGAFCNWGKSRELINDNPVSQIPWAKQVKSPPKALSDLELNRLMREVYKEGKKRDIALLELLAGAGLRIGEVAALKMDDIAISDRKGMVTVRQGKGSKYRQVPLNKDIRKAFLEYLEEKEAGTFLFGSQKGAGLSSNGIWRVVKKYGEKAGLGEITPHVLRHTFGTMLIRKHKIDLVTTATLMGHENISTTAVYTKPNQQDMVEAVEKLSKW